MPEPGEEIEIEILEIDSAKNSLRGSKISVSSITFSEASDYLTNSVSFVDIDKECIANNDLDMNERVDNYDEKTEIGDEDYEIDEDIKDIRTDMDVTLKWIAIIIT
ncbi:hypothetical protein DPMN_150705 [Dreissena polymorpha]|uniref:Uncharacterized protein n=1 Tax=Dreissena polymorpha TaxID=45954 RepID=A0A9D4FIH1_DREPO|nr:hypothetical protein DPMN_150705 [Dreissena polymorpha]